MDSPLALLLAITFVSCVIINIADMSELCKNCTESKELNETSFSSGELNVRKEIIKFEILDKLGLTHPPKVNKSFLPDILISGAVFEEKSEDEKDGNQNKFSKQDYYAVTRTIVLLPQNTTNDSCPQATSRSVCLYFNINNVEAFKESIYSIYLWTYRNKQEHSNLKYVLYKIQNAADKKEYSQQILQVPSSNWRKTNWYRFNVTEILTNPLNNYLIFQIDCDECNNLPIATNSKRSPFIVFRVNPKNCKC